MELEEQGKTKSNQSRTAQARKEKKAEMKPPQQDAKPESSRDIGVFSEVGTLRKVLVHTPGLEVERMTPETASELLYNEIIHFPHVKRAHGELKAILSQVAETIEVIDFLEDILQNDEVKINLLSQVLAYSKCQHLLPELLRMSSDQLAGVLVSGLPLVRDSLERYLSASHFSLLPLPNMYFMRDTSMVVGRRNIAAAMASPVRAVESLLLRALYRHHPRLVGKGLLLDGPASENDPDFTIEGGDVLVYNENTLLIGVSERTTPRAIDALIERLGATRREDGIEEDLHVFCVVLPRERSTIHLDMIFTLVDTHAAVIYEPYVSGRKRSQVVHIQVSSSGERRLHDAENLLIGLKKIGIKLEPIVCGGQNPLHQAREQWNSGANLFAFGPGRVICYEMHENTIEACRKAGFTVHSAQDIIANRELLAGRGRIVVTMEGSELARGGGGPRCMTCPVLRDRV